MGTADSYADHAALQETKINSHNFQVGDEIFYPKCGSGMAPMWLLQPRSQIYQCNKIFYLMICTKRSVVLLPLLNFHTPYGAGLSELRLETGEVWLADSEKAVLHCLLPARREMLKLLNI